MSTRWLKAIEGRIDALEREKRQEVDALARENADLTRRIALLEQNRDPGDEPEPPPKPARIPARPLLMQEMGVGVDPAPGGD